MFNVGDTNPEQIRVNWPELGLSGECTIRDLWMKKDTGKTSESQTFTVAPHASAFYKITSAIAK